LRTELDAAKAKLADAQKAAEMHGASVAELTGLNEKLTNEKTAAEKQIAQLRQASELSRAEFNELKGRVSANDQAAQSQLATINELTATNEKLTAQARISPRKLRHCARPATRPPRCARTWTA